MSQGPAHEHQHEQERQHQAEVENATIEEFRKLESQYSRDFGNALFQQARDIFMQLDVDGSGIIDLEDVEAYMAAEGWPVPDNLEEQFRAADKGGDGGLDVEEFLFFLAEAANSGNAAQQQASDELASDSNVEFRRSSRNTILLQSAKEEVQHALHELDVEKEHNLALQESIHKRDTHMLRLDEQVTLLRTSLDSTTAELDETLQQLRASELAREVLEAKCQEQAEELNSCRRELKELRGLDQDADDKVEARHSKRLSIQSTALDDDGVSHVQTHGSSVRRTSVQSNTSVGDNPEVLHLEPRQRLSVQSSKSIIDELESSMLQCEKLQATVDTMSTECTLIRCLAEWRLHFAEHQGKKLAAGSEAELQKLSGAATGLVNEVKSLGEQIEAVAPSPSTDTVAPRISTMTGRNLVLRCQLATLQQQCQDWRAALLEAYPVEAKPTEEERDMALFRGRLSNGSFVDELQDRMDKRESEVRGRLSNGSCMDRMDKRESELWNCDSKRLSTPAAVQDLLQLFCRFLHESDQKILFLEAKISNMEALRKLQYGLG